MLSLTKIMKGLVIIWLMWELKGSLTLEGANEPVTFIPGMTATVDVLSGKRTVLEYIWQPMSKVQELALRD